jgi:hypothetical protein
MTLVLVSELTKLFESYNMVYTTITQMIILQPTYHEWMKMLGKCLVFSDLGSRSYYSQCQLNKQVYVYQFATLKICCDNT